MTERPNRFSGPDDFDGEERQTEDLAPENQNFEQSEEDSQAQTVADEALDRDTAAFGLEDSEKAEGGTDDVDAPDLVDRMKQMESSGRIDMDAFRGEDNYDDNEDELGDAAKPDDLRSDGT